MAADLLFSSPIGFGCMGMTAFYGPAMLDADGVALLTAVRAAGYSHIDTAEIYQQFSSVKEGTQKYNEALVGLYLQTIPRNQITVATKFFGSLHDHKVDLETVVGAVDASLRRLCTDFLDIYYLHRMPASVELLEEWMRSMKVVVDSGRVRNVGLSEVPASWLRRAHAILPVTAVQQEWSLLTREPMESEVVPVCRELGITIVAYSPLARNLLAAAPSADGPPRDWRGDQPRFSAQNYESNKHLATQVAEIAARKGVSAASVSLAWLLHKGRDLGVRVVPIPGTTSEAHAKANMEAANSVSLTPEEMGQLEALGALVAGARGNEQYVSMAIEGKVATS
jgi:aryl-alcohol dehydrogenase-like predicted oxidoreductase